jgi:hypothetical protein
MRVRLPGALLLITVLGGVLSVVAGCATDTTPTVDSESVLGDDELNAVNNKMGLRLTYDDPSSHVRATVKMKLQSGERLVMRVRRGRLMAGGQLDLDCSLLGEALPLQPLAAAQTTGTTSNTTAPQVVNAKPIYVGPPVDRSLLACVYNQQWIDQNISADVLEQLSVDGTDAIVDACIVREGAVRARLQTSLQYAWDPRDPHIDPALVHAH